MKLDSLQDWIISADGLGDEITDLRTWSARRTFQGAAVIRERSLDPEENPDWSRLLLAASVLAESESSLHQETALMVAQAAVVFGADRVVQDSGALILTQLSNMRAVDLAQQRELIAPDLGQRLGMTQQLLATRRILDSSIALGVNRTITANDFQQELWQKLLKARWTSATAPTAAGKTFLVLNWLLGEVEAGTCKLGVFIAPTRALISEIEKELHTIQRWFRIQGLRVSSLPMAEMGDGLKPTLLVFTQERLHLFLNAINAPPVIDVTIVDEAQKLGDGVRGVILQDAIERVLRTSGSCRFVFLSPHSENPELLVDDAPAAAQLAVVPGGAPTVTQHLIMAHQRPYKPREWMLSLVDGKEERLFGEFILNNRPDGALKRIALVALELGRHGQGTLIYANGPANTEKIAHIIYDGLAEDFTEEEELDEELQDLSDFCRRSIHPKFLLVDLVKRGVAFHYGNMPAILRREIERLFRDGKIRFLVCTSTLVEGVNLACRTIVLRGPTKGQGNPMSAPDFWNLAGRAGRWGADFHGNIVCVDPHRMTLWPQGVPQRTAYRIQRQTDAVLSDAEALTSYVRTRPDRETNSLHIALDPVASYVIANYMRTGSSRGSPSVRRMDADAISALDDAVSEALSLVDLPEAIVSAHPSISAVAMQALLNEFRNYEADPVDLLPAPPESEDAVSVLRRVFSRVNRTLDNVFGSTKYQFACAIITVDWMRGKRIGEIIENVINVRRSQRSDVDDAEFNYAPVIRQTFQRIEDIARFKAPKFLSAYIDVLRFHFSEVGRLHDFPEDLEIELFLEFGVGTTTLLSLIGIGLSRSSAIELSEFLGRSELTEQEVLEELRTDEWEKLDLPHIVRREISETLERRLASAEDNWQ